MQKLSLWEKRTALSVAEAIALMLSFGSFVATLIFGILDAVNKKTIRKSKKKNRQALESNGFL